MTQKSLTREQSRRVDEIAIKDYGIPSLQLMETAGTGCAELLAARLTPASKVLVVTGKGNNGGDGFVIARILHQRRQPVKLWMTCTPGELSADAHTNWKRCLEQNVPMETGTLSEFEAVVSKLNDSDWIVDALFGTGLTSPPRSPYRELIEQINQSPAKVLAVDLPSGLNADTGEPMQAAVKADLTCTFVAQKTGFQRNTAKAWLGKVDVVDLQIPSDVITRASS